MPLSQAIKMLRFFIPKTDKNYALLSTEEKNAFRMFVFQSLNLILDTVFGKNFNLYSREVEAMYLYSLNVFKGVLLSENL